MIDASFIALALFSFVFHRHRRASLFFAPNQDGIRGLCQQYLSISAFQSFSVSGRAHGQLPGVATVTILKRAKTS
jgi:hypothetical protein